MVFDHHVKVESGEIRVMGEGIDAGILEQYSALAEPHLDYLTKWEAFRNIASAESEFYDLIRRGTDF